MVIAEGALQSAALIRGPLELPTFVTCEWLRDKIELDSSDLARLHAMRHRVLSMCGFADWPDNQPSMDDFLRLTVEGLRYPLFVMACNAILNEHSDGTFHGAFRARTLFDKFANSPKSKGAVKNARKLTHGEFHKREAVFTAILRLSGPDNAATHAFLNGTSVVYASECAASLSKLRSNDRTAATEQARKYLEGLQATVGARFDLKEFSHPGGFNKLLRMLRQAGTAEQTKADGETSAEPADADDASGPVDTPIDTGSGTAPDEIQELATDRSMDVDGLVAPAPDVVNAVTDMANGGHSDTSASGAPDGVLDRALMDWRSALDAARTAFDRLSEAAPDVELAASVSQIMERARSAATAWQDALPKGVDADELKRLVIKIADGLGESTGFDRDMLRQLDTIDRITNESATLAADECATAQLRLDEGRCLSDEAAVMHAEVSAGKLSKQDRANRYARMSELENLSEDCDAKAAKHLSQAVRLLAEGRITPTAPFERAILKTELPTAVPEGEPKGSAEDALVEPKEGSSEDGDVSGLRSEIRPPCDHIEDDIYPETDVFYDVPDLAEAELASDDDTVPEIPSPAMPTTDRDPLADEWNDKLIELLEHGEVGAAYHLAAAADASVPDYEPLLSAAELRFLAETGHINYADALANDGVTRMITAAYDAVQAASADGETTVARRLMMTAASLEVALFLPDSPASDILAITETDEFNSYLYAVKQAVLEHRKARLPITLPLMRALAADARNGVEAESLRKSIVATIEAMPTELRLDFSQGVRVVNRLFKDSEISRLRDGLANPSSALQAARTLVEAYAEENDIRALIQRISDEINPRNPVVGSGRDKLVRAILDIVGNCRSYIALAEARPAALGTKQKSELIKLHQSLLSTLDRAANSLEQVATSGRLTAVAVKYSANRLRGFSRLLKGESELPGTNDRLIAVHGVLTWLPDLRYADSWFPNPYVPEAVIRAVCSVALPIIRFGDTEAMRAAVRARVEEKSYISARMLIDTASYYGVDAADAESIRSDEISANEPICRSALKQDMERARRRVSMTQRMGLQSLDLDLLFDRLQSVQPEELPLHTSIEMMSEEQDCERILDFAAVGDMVVEIEQEVDRLTRPKREELAKALDDLADKIRPEDVREVRAQIEDRNLMECEELLSLLRETGKLPASRSINRAFHEYFPAVPDWLDSDGANVKASEIEQAIRSGESIGPLNFGRVIVRLRDKAAEIWDNWVTLKKRMERNIGTDLFGSVHSLLERLGLPIDEVTPGPIGKASQRFRTGTAKIMMVADDGGLLLPEFGSLSRGEYKLCLAASLNTVDVELMCDGGTEPILLVVGGTVNRAKRITVALLSIPRKRPILILDESLLLYALTERETRPMVLFECGQPFSWAAPYKDYGQNPVPTEVFVGRARFLGSIADPHGGFIVFGGRRLGKTALLLHAKAMYHNPDDGKICACVDIASVGRSGGAVKPWALWSMVSANDGLKPIFKTPVTNAEEFAAGVRKWLDSGKQRSVLLLLDEAENFIEADAAGVDRRTPFTEFNALKRLMTDTEKRFKVVLAGLHNISRVVRAQNSPLKHIAQEVIRIGPLMDDDLSDAERLLTRPLASLGIEFAQRIDVWRILTKSNYLPVLIHMFCQTLLAKLQADWVSRGRIRVHEDWVVTSEMVSDMLNDRKLSEGLQTIFNLTISGCDDRYAVIAYAAAHRWYADIAAGTPVEGVSPLEVRDVAAIHWPKVFAGPHGLALIEDLMDEMETLGVLRRVDQRRWTLRSKLILDYLGSSEEVVAKLEEFRNKEEPDSFDLLLARRAISDVSAPKIRDATILSPLTVSQEFDILNNKGPQIRIILGNTLSSISQVSKALEDAQKDTDGAPGAELLAKAWASGTELARDISKYQRKDGIPGLFVVRHNIAWDVSWAEAILDQKAVKEGRVRVLLIGDHSHTWRWVSNPATLNSGADLTITPLGLWSRRSVTGWLKRRELPGEPLADELLEVTGGFHKPTWELLSSLSGKKERDSDRIHQFRTKLAKDPALAGELGLAHTPITATMLAIRGIIGEGRTVSAYEINEVISRGTAGTIDGTTMLRYGTLLGLFLPQPMRHDLPEDERLYLLNPLAHAILSVMPQATEVAA